jgi:hypothetical protein
MKEKLNDKNIKFSILNFLEKKKISKIYEKKIIEAEYTNN